VDWSRPFTKIKDVSYAADDLHIRWYEDGELNVCHNCVDRHLDDKGDQPAIVWEGDDPSVAATLTYRQLYERVCRFANVLKSLGVSKGDRVTLYMPMIPEAAVAMLACARIGAVHSVVFGGFSPDALAGRIVDCDSNVIITADEGLRGGRKVPLKANVDAAAAKPGVTTLEKVLVVRNTGGDVAWTEGRDVWLHEAEESADAHCPPEPMNAEDPLFILYTSGSTGQPKGVLHTTGGYLVYAAFTFKYVFNYEPGDVYWCTADVGWVTGHSYIVYGPLANGAITLMFEGVPNYPDSSRFWQVCDKHGVNIVYTAPTAIRALMPGSATRPLFGIQPALVDGDGARRDEDGYYWITGRVDDVLNVSGHRMGTAEIESALVAHSAVAEAAVVGYPHDIKGQGIYAYVTLMDGVEPGDELLAEIRNRVRKEIGPIATPDLVQWAPGLPKTRSGKIMRRILRKVAENDYGSLGDTSTLADPGVVDDLIANRRNRS